jgi:hypothetical protein
MQHQAIDTAEGSTHVAMLSRKDIIYEGEGYLAADADQGISIA